MPLLYFHKKILYDENLKPIETSLWDGYRRRGLSEGSSPPLTPPLRYVAMHWLIKRKLHERYWHTAFSWKDGVFAEHTVFIPGNYTWSVGITLLRDSGLKTIIPSATFFRVFNEEPYVKD